MGDSPAPVVRSPARINYKHLQYFHAVVREGSVSGAARRLHVAPQTVGAQVRSLGRSLGRPLSERVVLGRVPQLRQPLYLIRPAGRRSHPLLDAIA